MMNVSVSGRISVQLTGADISGSYKALNDRNIPLYCLVQEDELTACFQVDHKDYDELRFIARKRGDRVKVLGRLGPVWLVKELLRRSVILCGLVVFFFAVAFIPGRILFFRVEGNIQVPAQKVLEAAQSCSVRFGTKRQNINNEKFKNSMLLVLPELRWVCVNTKGCVAEISVLEQEPEQPSQVEGLTSIVALRDATIDELIVRGGTAQAEAGDTVSGGQVLISGYTDCGGVILGGSARGEVYGITRHELKAVSPAQSLRRTLEGDVDHRLSIVVGKKRINLWKGSGIYPSTCGRIYKEYCLTLPGGFRLPVTLEVETITHYSCDAFFRDGLEESLTEQASGYLTSQMTAGVILDTQSSLTGQNAVWLFQGSYRCRESIGISRQEQIGEKYE